MLSECVAMYVPNFERVFARKVGISPAGYVRQVRVEAAQRMIGRSENGLEQIASACGFSLMRQRLPSSPGYNSPCFTFRSGTGPEEKKPKKQGRRRFLSTACRSSWPACYTRGPVSRPGKLIFPRPLILEVHFSGRRVLIIRQQIYCQIISY